MLIEISLKGVPGHYINKALPSDCPRATAKRNLQSTQYVNQALSQKRTGGTVSTSAPSASRQPLFTYLHVQAKPIYQDLLARMLIGGNYSFVPKTQAFDLFKQCPEVTYQ